jgi:serine/threonine protein kinase/Flp pilus assembly protein TadD
VVNKTVGDMSAIGIFDSVRIEADVTACEQCGSTSRVGRGLCLNCLLLRCLGSDSENKSTLKRLLDEIDVRDADWRIGNYQILEEIGRGGMGVIYRARQRHSRRIVALKRMLSFQADSQETLARFRREAEAVASLDHPNILPIHEVSEGEDGLPFFSMKFAAGGSLVDAAPALRDEPRRSVELMAKVARAVQYAHGHGILHRDLKPGNILLDGRGEPLVSDFGLAKWLDTTSDVTRTLTIFGTPGYIAPEQAKRSAAKLTPAADVYSLGAILFELFTGRPPFLGEHALAVIQQASEKPAPKLRSLIPGFDRDLETICAKCLECEPNARYRSAGDLAEDLERWLEGRPIKTRRVLPSTHAWRWSRRNPALVGTAAVCLLLGAASLWLLREPDWRRQISAATKKLLLSPQQAAEQAKLHQALIEYPESYIGVESSHFMQSPGTKKERLYSILATSVGLDAKILTDKLPKFSQAVKRDPDASGYERACAAYLGEDYTEAERLFLITADEAQRAIPPKTVDIIRALKLAARSAQKLDERVRAKEHLVEAEKLTDRQRNPREWADVQYAIANVLLAVEDDAPDAEKLLRAAIEARTRLYGYEDRETLKARRWLGLSLQHQSRYPEAEAEFREVVKLDEKMLGPENPETLRSRWDLFRALSRGIKTADALIESQQILKLREKVLGPEDPETLDSRDGVANTLGQLGRFSEAISQRRELLQVQDKVLGPDDQQTLQLAGELGYNLVQAGEFREGESMLRRAYNGLERRLGSTHRTTTWYRHHLVLTLAVQDKDVEAEAEAREIVKIQPKAFSQPGWSRALLGVVLDKQGKHKEAEVQIREALGGYEKAFGIDDSATLDIRSNLARNLWYQGRNAEAETLLRELIKAHEKMLGAQVYLLENNASSRVDEFDALTPLECRTLFANTLRDQRKYAEAEAEYKQVIQAEENVLGPEHRDTLNACYNFAYQLGQQGKRDQAKALAERAAKSAAKVLDVNDPYTREYAKFLEELESGHAITMPAVEFRKTFVSGNKVVEQGPR